MTATVDWGEAVARRWDCLVVGAGPAGSVAAREMARAGHQVLLLDRAVFPRSKVCGGCLHPRALTRLAELGLGTLPERLGAVPLRRVVLAVRGRRAELDLPPAMALSRTTLDAALVDEAVAAGAAFLPGTEARASWPSGAERVVHVRDGELRCRLLLCADGLGARLLARGGELAAPPRPRSRLGLATMLPDASGYPAGTVTMAVGPSGYVGVAQVEQGQLVVAAALEPSACRSESVRRLLAEAGLPLPGGLDQAGWHGTSALTRRASRAGAERALLLGDAAGYIEPFTGEGMAWALEAAAGIRPWAEEAIRGWSEDLPERWRDWLAYRLGGRWRRCALTASLVRRTTLLAAMLAVGGVAPAMARATLRAAYVGGGR